MAWSYSGNPASSTRDLVRFLIQDTDTTNQLLSNEELDYLIVQYTDAYAAAVAAVGVLIASASRVTEESKKVADLSLTVKPGARVAQWQALQKSLQAERFRLTPGSPVYNVNAQLPTTEGIVEGEGTDFYVGQMDNNT